MYVFGVEKSVLALFGIRSSVFGLRFVDTLVFSLWSSVCGHPGLRSSVYRYPGLRSSVFSFRCSVCRHPCLRSAGFCLRFVDTLKIHGYIKMYRHPTTTPTSGHLCNTLGLYTMEYPRCHLHFLCIHTVFKFPVHM